MGLLEKLGFKKKESVDAGVKKSRDGMMAKLAKVVAGKSKIDERFLDELEEVLITSDVGVKTTLAIIERIEKRVAVDKYVDQAELQQLLRDEISDLLAIGQDSVDSTTFIEQKPKETPHVIMIVGVNGVGKTTSIGKLAHLYKAAGHSVLLGAADTFRAAAVNQLTIWAERAGVPIIQQGQNADPAAVAFDTVAAAKARNTEIVLIDTAGRLHNKLALMDELSKIKRVMSKVMPGAPHEVILVLDASTGQNAMQQAKAFTEAVDITGLILTKLDGTAKGGIVLGISHELSVPVRFIGVGEKIEDLQVFDKATFVNALFN